MEVVLTTPRDLSTTFAFRLIHCDALPTLLARGRIHAPNHVQDDGRPYPSIHDTAVQRKRARWPVPCGAGGTIGDYVGFYFGRHSPMLLRLATGQVAGYEKGQDPLLYLTTSIADVVKATRDFAFTDGHSLARFTHYFDDLNQLDDLDWSLIENRYWADTDDDNDRERRKQAELLVHRELPWAAIRGIAVRTSAMATRVRGMLETASAPTPVEVLANWYYRGKR